jgi:hypothetical protein
MQAKQINIAKEVNVLHIDSNELNKYWPLVEFMLAEGLKYDGNPMSITHLKKEILANTLQLFMMFGSDDAKSYKVFGVFVTRINQLPNFKQIEVILLKGVKRELWQKQAAYTIENLAKNTGCKRIAVHGRPGWESFLKGQGWKVKRYLYTKEIQ